MTTVINTIWYLQVHMDSSANGFLLRVIAWSVEKLAPFALELVLAPDDRDGPVVDTGASMAPNQCTKAPLLLIIDIMNR